MSTETVAGRPRVHDPASPTEMNRRWDAIRGQMAIEGIDVLVASANNDYMGGYVKYLTDEPAMMGYPVTVVFPREGLPTMVRNGPFGERVSVPPHEDDLWAGPGTMLTTGSFASVSYTQHYDADLIVSALRPYEHGRIGIVGASQFAAPTYARTRAVLSRADFIDASHVVDAIRMTKSDEERSMIRRTAALQDTVMEQVIAAARPGMRDSELTSLAMHLAADLGSEQGTYPCCSTSPGQPTYMALRHWQNRVMEAGDIVYLLLETNGPGGQYAQLGRAFVLGSTPATLRREFEFTKQVREHYLNLLVAGTPAADLWREFNDFMREHGRDEERRLNGHGQGYDIVERPLLRFDEPGTIERDMYFAFHPVHTVDGYVSWFSENYLIGSDGRAEVVHQFPMDICER